MVKRTGKGGHNKLYKNDADAFLKAVDAKKERKGVPYPWRTRLTVITKSGGSGGRWRLINVYDWLVKETDWGSYRSHNAVANILLEIAVIEFEIHRMLMLVDQSEYTHEDLKKDGQYMKSLFVEIRNLNKQLAKYEREENDAMAMQDEDDEIDDMTVDIGDPDG